MRLIPKQFSCCTMRSMAVSVSNNKLTQLLDKTAWSGAINEAEKVVGYPTSFLSLRWILNDEIANVARHLRNLMGTNHPLLKTAKKVILNNDLTWGLIVLLVAKTVGTGIQDIENERDRAAGILPSQRVIAEITEMTKASNLMHKGILNLSQDDANFPHLQYGNKLALLAGDYLLAQTFRELAKLRNCRVQEIMCSSIRDLAKGEFVGERDKQNAPILHEKLNKYGWRTEWELRASLGGGTLLANSCQSVCILAGLSIDEQQAAYEFGRAFGLVWQASIDLRLLQNADSGEINLVSAPVLLHLETEPDFYKYINFSKYTEDNINYDLVRKIVLNGAGPRKTKLLKMQYAKSAEKTLARFNDSDSKEALVKIIYAL